MTSSKPPYYRVKNGMGRCSPSLKMKRNGFAGLDCGPDGPEAWARADAWYADWLKINKALKNPSVVSADSGYVVFVRTGSHVSINYVPEQSNKFELARLSLGEAFESMLIVRGSKQDVLDLQRRLAASRTSSGFGLTGEVLREMRQAADAQKVNRISDTGAQGTQAETGTPRKRSGRSDAYTTDLTDAQWEVILPILTARAASGRRHRAPTREVINAIIHHLRSGRPWTKLPKHMPHHIKARLAYVSLVQKDRWELVEEVLRTPKPHEP